MTGMKQFFMTLMYIVLALAIIAVLVLSYVFATSISNTDMNAFLNEQEVKIVEFLDEAKVFAKDTAITVKEKAELIATNSIMVTQYISTQMFLTTESIHKDAVEKYIALEIAKNPPIEIIEPVVYTPQNFTSTTLLSTQGEHELVYYNQTAEPWRNMEYGPNNTIAKYGCGPTSMAMVLSTFLQEDITPETASRWAYNNNYFAHNSGSYHSLIPEMAEAYGLEWKSLRLPTKNDLINELNDGNLIVVLLGYGTFASAGHFVVLRDVSESGEIYMADSQSDYNSLQAWDPDLFLNEAKYYANSGGPFWSIIQPEGQSKKAEEAEEDEFLEGVVELVVPEVDEEVVLEEGTILDGYGNVISLSPKEELPAGAVTDAYGSIIEPSDEYTDDNDNVDVDIIDDL